MKSRKTMVRLSGLLKRIPESVWLGAPGPQKKKTKTEKRAAKLALRAALEAMHVENRERHVSQVYGQEVQRSQGKHYYRMLGYICGGRA